MEYLLLFISILLWILYALISGYSEAGYWYYKYNGESLALPKYEHELWSLMRGILLLLIFYGYYSLFGWYAILGIIGLACMFPYFHDGMYYYQRNKYDGSYPSGWRSTSRTSTANMTIDYRTRLMMFTYLSTLFIFSMISNNIYNYFNN